MLYAHFGWSAPHIFSIVGVGLDLVARLLVVEVDPVEIVLVTAPIDGGLAVNDISSMNPVINLGVLPQVAGTCEENSCDVRSPPEAVWESSFDVDGAHLVPRRSCIRQAEGAQVIIPLWRIFMDMAKSPRGVSGFAMSFVFGLTLGIQDST